MQLAVLDLGRFLYKLLGVRGGDTSRDESAKLCYIQCYILRLPVFRLSGLEHMSAPATANLSANLHFDDFGAA